MGQRNNQHFLYFASQIFFLQNNRQLRVRRVYSRLLVFHLKVLSSEMDPAEIRLIR